ncbi:MAG: Uncharacterized protein G01um101425_412 [Candidatus Peregrinibacteria bacterium Gr01-1014_25]|nr:MAG: Uncharacterized protein G01um101425_412 [Candidatus Peregrinibacteria bacterium Gr01-1014_25]
MSLMPILQVPPPMKPDEKKALWMALNLAWELGFLIAVPAFVFGFGGAYLDQKWETSPWIALAGLFLAFTISAITIVKRVREVMRVTDR